MTHDTIQPTRRALLGASAALGLGAAGRQARAQALNGTTLVFASWGGVYQETQKTCYCDPFAAETGARVVQDGPMNAARFRTMIESGTPDWDVVDVTLNFLVAGVPDRLFEKIDTSVVDVSRISPEFVHEYGVGCINWSYNLGYNTKLFPAGKRPASWGDFFDLKTFPGKRSLTAEPTAVLEAALMADGVKIPDLYPLDVERALRKLDTIKPQIVFWSTNSQSQQLFVDEEVALGMIINSRAYDAARKGADIAVIWEGNIQSVDYLVVPRGSRNKAAAMKLIDTMTRPENQAKMANMLGNAPTNPKAFATIDKAMNPWLSTSPENTQKGLVIDAAWWRQNERAIQERWAAWKLAR